MLVSTMSIIIIEKKKNTYFEEHLRTATSVYSNGLLKYKNRVIKNVLPDMF